MPSVEIKVGQKWVATKDVAVWKKGMVVEITEKGTRIRFKNSDGQEEFIFNNPEGVVWFKSIYKLVVDDQVNEEMGTAESLRNSILGIRSKREALQKEILQLDKQEKEAVEKLKEQGFVLYEDNVSKEPVATENKAVLYAEDIGEDMTVPKNWRVGDLVQCASTSHMVDMTKGKNYEINGIDGECISLIDDAGDVTYREADSRFKFHSRPVK